MSAIQVSEYTRNARVHAKHRREVLLHIIAPVAVTALVLAIVIIVTVIVATPRQFDTVASFMSLVILVPTVLVCLVPYVLMIALFVGTRRLYNFTNRHFRTARNALYQVSMTTRQLSRRVASPIIWVSERLAWLENIKR